MSKLTRTFSLTEPTHELLNVLARLQQRKRSAQVRFMIIQTAEAALQEGGIPADAADRMRVLIDRARSEVYEPEDPPEEVLDDILFDVGGEE